MGLRAGAPLHVRRRSDSGEIQALTLRQWPVLLVDAVDREDDQGGKPADDSDHEQPGHQAPSVHRLSMSAEAAAVSLVDERGDVAHQLVARLVDRLAPAEAG